MCLNTENKKNSAHTSKMDPIPQIDVNDVITREKLFLEHATKFMESVKLNLPAETGKQIRSDEEIAACNKVKNEREEGRKMKEKERKIRESKYKKKNNKVKMEEFVGDEEFAKSYQSPDEEIAKEIENEEHGRRNKKVRKIGNKSNERNEKEKSVYKRNNNFERGKKRENFGKKVTGKKRLGKSRRAERRNNKQKK